MTDMNTVIANNINRYLEMNHKKQVELAEHLNLCLLYTSIPGQGIIRTAILVPWAIPTVVSGIIWTQFFSQNGLVNYIMQVMNLAKEPLNWLGNEWLARLSRCV